MDGPETERRKKASSRRKSPAPLGVDLAEVLVRQADHRLSESLQLVASCLRTQSWLAEPKARAELEEASRRIAVVSRLHNRLALSGKQGLVALDDYLIAFGEDLSAAFLDASRSLLVNVDNLEAPARLAAVIGVVAHELILNALKHTFPEHGGIIELACGANPDGSLT